MLVQFVKQSLNHLTEEARVAAGDAVVIPLPGEPRSAVPMCVLDKHLYVGGGWAGHWVYDFYRINEQTLDVEQLADHPVVCDYCAVMTTHNGKIYHITRVSAAPYDLVPYEYDPTTDTWTEKTHQAVNGGGWEGVAVNGKVYLGCWSHSESLYVYDIDTDTWTALTGDPYRSIVGYWNGKLFGSVRARYNDTTGKYYKTMRVYDIATDIWSDFGTDFPVYEVGVRPYIRSYKFFAVDGVLYGIGGYSGHLPDRTLLNFYACFWKYSSGENEWYPILLHPRIARLVGGFEPTLAISNTYLYVRASTLHTFKQNRTAPIVRIPLALLRRW